MMRTGREPRAGSRGQGTGAPGANCSSARGSILDSRLRAAAFSLFEVMIAIGIFFMAVFAILGLVSNALRNARWIQQTTVDAAMIASELTLTNRLIEHVDSGDFGDLYPDFMWTSDTYEVASNSLFQVDYIVQRQKGNQAVESKMSILLFRPESPPGSLSGGLRR